MAKVQGYRGFVLAELAVCVVVALVVLGCLAPLMERHQRALARNGGCEKNLGTLALAMNSYFSDQRYFPPAYVYGSLATGTSWNLNDQQVSNPNPNNGYVHWSGLLSGLGYVANESTYGCPEVLNTGAPNANPGPVASNWEAGQINDLGASSPAALPSDRQAKRLAYAANGAVLPRNRFGGSSVRKAKLFNGNVTDPASDTALDPSALLVLTEWALLPGTGPTGGWAGLTNSQGVYKSHRPITPFMGVTSGADVYSEPDVGTAPRFRYPTQAEILPLNQLGAGFFTGGMSELNAVGRHHTGGTALFAFLDGNVQQMTVQQSIQQKKWGKRFPTITGRNMVAP